MQGRPEDRRQDELARDADPVEHLDAVGGIEGAVGEPAFHAPHVLTCAVVVRWTGAGEAFADEPLHPDGGRAGRARDRGAPRAVRE
ncbi:MAG: hypothetical protein DMD79_06355 [Candidatus Rokuibacteriota bacterium]|nr:MAG: hypothetical protein DMD79_06355 [Candidatus Rokubacteria bacterium]